MAHYPKMTPERKTAFLGALRHNGGNATNAAKIVEVSKETVFHHKRLDPEFAAEWIKAVHESTDVLESEAIRRAVDGFTEPIFFQGVQCGEVRKYSDLLLIFMLKARRPNVYRENIRHEHGGLDDRPISIHAVSDEELERIITAAAAELIPEGVE